jgi:hypothetical protein
VADLEGERSRYSMNRDNNFRFVGIIAQHSEVSFKLAVQFFRFQVYDNFPPPAGLDVRIEPHHLNTSGVFYFGNGKEGIPGIDDLKDFLNVSSGPGQISGIKVHRRNGYSRAV